jgi:hypothetical protein
MRPGACDQIRAMGMTEGAIIGGVAGGLATLVMVWRQTLWQKRLLRTLTEKGHDAARALLDSRAPTLKPQKSFPISKLIQQRTRISGLTVLGDVAEIARELSQHSGGTAYKFQVQGFGLLGLAIHGDDTAGRVRELEELSRVVTAEANVLQKLVKERLELLARLGQALSGATPLVTSDEVAILRWAKAEPVLTRVVLFRGLDLAAQKSGGSNAGYRAAWQELTTAFER